jgi:hypothetical protein
MNIERCAKFGKAAVDAGTPDRGQNTDRVDATDAVANILHYLDSLGEPNPVEMLSAAADYYFAEKAEEAPKLIRIPESEDPRFAVYAISERDGSVYTLESGVLVQYPQVGSADAHERPEGVAWDPTPGAGVAWDCIEEDAVLYLRRVEALLKEAMS